MNASVKAYTQSERGKERHKTIVYYYSNRQQPLIGLQESVYILTYLGQLPLTPGHLKQVICRILGSVR